MIGMVLNIVTWMFFIFMFGFTNIFYIKWKWAWRGSLRREKYAVFCRISVFPGWLYFPSAIISIVVSVLTDGPKVSTPSWIEAIPDWVAAALLGFVGLLWFFLSVSYSLHAIHFLKEDDWWKGLGKKAKKSLKSLFAPAPQPSFGGIG